jgi:putative holliday junction resolvase
MRILALDYGEKNMGVALSDPLGLTAGALTTLRRESIKKDLLAIHTLVETYQVEKVVLGLPLNMDGRKGPAALRVEAFARRLQGRLRVPVVLWDERLSTVAAGKALREGEVGRREQGKVIDSMAAAIILQGYLDAVKAGPETLD